MRPSFSLLRTLALLAAHALAFVPAWAQVCASPGKDGPVTIAGANTEVNSYFQGNDNLLANATTLTLGAQSGSTALVAAGDKLLLVQMQGAAINNVNNNCYGDGLGPCTDTDTRAIGADKAQGFLDNASYTAGRYEYVRVTAVTGAGGAGSVVTFTPALTYAYTQASPDLTIGQRRYQVLRVPQYATLSITGSIRPLRWNGLVGGVTAVDVAGAASFSGAGPHINASGTGFRTGYGERGGVANGDRLFQNQSDALAGTRDTTKGEGIAGTPRFMWIATDPLLAPLALTGVALTNPNLNANTQGYPGGDYGRGAPGNAGGGGISHNSAGGGGGNGGRGGAGGATWSGDGSRDVGGYGGAKLPQTGAVDANRLVMGGGGGAGDVNGGGAEPTNPYEGPGGVGGGMVFFSAASTASSGFVQADGTTGPNTFFDAAGGGGAGGSVRLIFGAGTALMRIKADGGQGALHDATGQPDHCSGSGGGAGGGVIVSNGSVGGASTVAAGLQGPNPPDNPVNCQGDAGEAGAILITAPSTQIGVQPGYQCLPQLVVSKRTSTPSRTTPPDTTAQYVVNVTNTGGGVAWGVGVQDTLPVPFGLPAVLSIATATSVTTSGPAAATNTSGVTPTAAFGTVGGSSTNSYVIAPGGSLTLTFIVSLNTTSSGTYQNSAQVRYTDPVRSAGGAAQLGNNPTVTPGGTYASGNPVPGSNYAASSSTQEDVTLAGTPPTFADLAVTKSGSTNVFVGDVVTYVMNVSNTGPANAGTATFSDTISSLIGTVTWVCVVVGGMADCDSLAGGTGATGSGNLINLARLSLNSGGAVQITASGIAASAGLVTNTATITLNTPGLTDPNPSNNTGTVTTTIAALVADLVVTKSNGVSTVTSGGATTYQIVVGNLGPAPGNGTVVTDPVAAGLAKLSVACTALNGAACPFGLSTATFQAGIAIPTLPVGGTLTFLLTVQVTAAANSNVSNTATVAPPAGTTDPVSANNSSTDTDAVVAPTVAVVSTPNFCPIGSTEQLVNLFTNGDLSSTGASVGGNIPQFAVNFQVQDTSMAIQQGARNYGSTVTQAPFIGDSSRSVGATNNWLLSNGNNLGAAYRIFEQQVNGLVVGRSYQFMYYGSNATNRGSTNTAVPVVQVRLTGISTSALVTHTYANEAAGGTDTWTLRQSTFAATTATMGVALWDLQTGADSDTFAATQFILRECRPQADPRVTKSDGVTGVTTLSTTTYIIVVSNPGPGDADSIIVRDPVATGLQKDSVSCASGGGGTCPVPVTITGLEGAGLTISQLPAGSTVTFTLVVSVQALSGTVTNTVNLTLPPGLVDLNLTNNSSSDVNTVTGLVNLQISKTNGTSTLVAGSTTSYTVTVSNFGPSFADGAVLTDPVTTGLSCTGNVTCTSTDGTLAICPGGTQAVPSTTFPMTTLQGAGAAIVRLRPISLLSFVFTCGVTATGN